MRIDDLRHPFASRVPAFGGSLIMIGRPFARTRPAAATCGTIRRQLTRIGTGASRVGTAMASTHPRQDVFRIAHVRLSAAAAQCGFFHPSGNTGTVP